MNCETGNKAQGMSGIQRESFYRWEIHQVCNSRHQQGPCGTCATEAGARACIEAALSGTLRPDAYAWGLLSRVPATPPDGGQAASYIPLAWAAPGPGGMVAWLPPGGRPLVARDVNETPVGSSWKSVSPELADFGSAVHRHRLAAGLTRRELAERSRCSTALIERIENAEKMPSRDFAQRADEALRTDGLLAGLWPALIESAYPDWFWQIIELEQQASFIQEFETVAVPGLLQTESYARAIFSAAHPMASELQIEQFVAARIDRQRIFRRPDPPQIVITLDEGVLRRNIGGSSIMSEQLEHLLDRADLPKVHLQVIPFGVREHPGGMTPFRLMGFREGSDVLYGETFIGGQMTNDAGQLQQHKLAFSLIQAKALSRYDSRVLIRHLKEEINRGVD